MIRSAAFTLESLKTDARTPLQMLTFRCKRNLQHQGTVEVRARRSTQGIRHVAHQARHNSSVSEPPLQQCDQTLHKAAKTPEPAHRPAWTKEFQVTASADAPAVPRQRPAVQLLYMLRGKKRASDDWFRHNHQRSIIRTIECWNVRTFERSNPKKRQYRFRQRVLDLKVV